MRESPRKLLAWFDHRTGLESAVRNFLDEDIPGIQRLAPGLRQRRPLPVHGAGAYGRPARLQLRGDSR